MATSELWRFLPVGYLFTVAFETPVLLLMLSRRHPFGRRLLAGLWLTACTYPVVVLVLPPLFANSTRAAYLAVAEVFAPVAECALFWLAFGVRGVARRETLRDFAVITAANLLSFLAGEVAGAYDWFGLFR
ncbi:MAG TPA: hypothetical protein VF736_12100 [Pyrinomonadaceae bacterium]|jgi:hypothetical protein